MVTSTFLLNTGLIFKFYPSVVWDNSIHISSTSIAGICYFIATLYFLFLVFNLIVRIYNMHCKMLFYKKKKMKI
jgi:hypothetical protein